MEIDWALDEHVRIRSLMPSDADALYAVVDANRDHLRPWMGWEPSTQGPGDVRAFIERSRASEHDMEANGIYLDDSVVGSIGLTVEPLDAKGEIGYWLDARHQGRGLVTRACRRFIDFAFDDLDLGRITLLAAVSNAPSRAVAERLGMTQEGIQRSSAKVADGRLDLVMYSILPHEWPGG